MQAMETYENVCIWLGVISIVYLGCIKKKKKHLNSLFHGHQKYKIFFYVPSMHCSTLFLGRHCSILSPELHDWNEQHHRDISCINFCSQAAGVSSSHSGQPTVLVIDLPQ